MGFYGSGYVRMTNTGLCCVGFAAVIAWVTVRSARESGQTFGASLNLATRVRHSRVLSSFVAYTLFHSPFCVAGVGYFKLVSGVSLD